MSIVYQALCLSDPIPWIYLSLPLYYHKGFDLGHAWMVQFKSEFGNKEFMIWATVSSQFSFCWLYRASLSLAAKNMINDFSIDHWWCPCIESSLCHWKRVFAMSSAFSWENSISLWPASFCTPRSNLPVTPCISWLPTFAFQSPMMKRASFLVLVLKGLH